MAMNELRKEVEAAAMAELNRANAKFPLFNSTHEGYAVILEEAKEYLNYCRTGCKNCYKWNGYCRSQASGTPYKKFRRKYHDMSKYRTDV